MLCTGCLEIMLNARPAFIAVSCAAFAFGSIMPAMGGLLSKALTSVQATIQTQQVLGSSGPMTAVGPLLPTVGQGAATIVDVVHTVGTGESVPTTTLTFTPSGGVTLNVGENTSVSLSVDVETAQRLRGMAGKRVIVTRRKDGSVTVTPAFQQLAGTIASINATSMTVRTFEGGVVQVVLPRLGTAEREFHVGSILTAISWDGGATMTAFVARSASRRIHYLGHVISRSASSISLLTDDGVTHTLACGTCDPRVFDASLRNANNAVYVEVSPLGQIVRAAPLVDGTRIVGTVVGTQDSTLALLTGTGDVLMLDCTCRMSSSAFTTGVPMLLDLNAQGVVTYFSANIQLVATPAPKPTSVVQVKRALDCRNHSARCPSGSAGTQRDDQLLAAAPAEDYVADSCFISSGTVINVRVHDSRTELPMYHAHVQLSGPSGTTWLTSQDGSLEFDNAPPGTYRVTASKPGFSAATTTAFSLGCHQGLVAEFKLTPLSHQHVGMSARVNPPSDPTVTRVAKWKFARERRSASVCRFASKGASARSRRFVCSGY